MHTNQPNSGEKLYNLVELNKMAGNDAAFIQSMVQLFIETIPGVLATMKQASDAGDWKAVGTTAHKLKATVETMKILSISDLVKQTEKDGKFLNNIDQIPANVSQIIATLNECISQLKTDFSL